MSSINAAQKAAINAAKIAREPLEALRSQAAPFLGEAQNELFPFKSISRQSKSLAEEELKRARQKNELERSETADDERSEQRAREVASIMRQEYARYEMQSNKEQTQFKTEITELKQEIAKLAQTTGVETKVHMQNTNKKVGIIDIKFLTKIVTFLRLKAEESRSAKDLQAQRQNSKRATGMLAWVSGKQMKVHEQGTLHLQG